MQAFHLDQRWRTSALFGAIVLVALALRLYHIDSFPPGLYPDVAANGTDALRMPGHLGLIYYRGAGNSVEGMIIWLEWPVMLLAGRAPLFVYLTTIILALITLPVHYALAKRLFNSRIALISCALLAVSFWDVHFSRIGYRTLLMPLWCDLVFLSGYWAWSRGGRWRWAVAGAALGIGNYTYTSYRLLFVVLAAIGLFVWWRRRALPGNRSERAAYGVAAAIFSLPFAVLAIVDPRDVFSRSEGVSVFGGGLAGLPGRLLSHLIKTLLMFNVSGDPERQYNVPGLPLFDPLVGVAFVIGVVIALRNWRQTRYFALLVWLGAFALVVMLSDRTPHVLRASGMIPPAYLLAAVGLHAATQRLRTSWQHVAVSAVVILSAAWTAFFYFVVYPTIPGLYVEFTGDRVDLGKFIVASDFGGRPIDITFNYYQPHGQPPHPDPFRGNPVRFETYGRVDWTFLTLGQLNQIPRPARQAVVFEGSDYLARQELTARFPAGHVVYVLSLPAGYHYCVFYTDSGNDFRPGPVGPYTNL